MQELWLCRCRWETEAVSRWRRIAAHVKWEPWRQTKQNKLPQLQSRLLASDCCCCQCYCMQPILPAEQKLQQLAHPWMEPTTTGSFSFIYFFWNTTADPNWQAIDSSKSSSLAEGRQEFHLHTTRFELRTFFYINLGCNNPCIMQGPILFLQWK